MWRMHKYKRRKKTGMLFIRQIGDVIRALAKAC